MATICYLIHICTHFHKIMIAKVFNSYTKIFFYLICGIVCTLLTVVYHAVRISLSCIRLLLFLEVFKNALPENVALNIDVIILISISILLDTYM